MKMPMGVNIHHSAVFQSPDVSRLYPRGPGIEGNRGRGVDKGGVAQPGITARTRLNPVFPLKHSYLW